MTHQFVDALAIVGVGAILFALGAGIRGFCRHIRWRSERAALGRRIRSRVLLG